MVLGPAGAGKSTTNYWISYHGEVVEEWREMFSRAQSGSASHTQIPTAVPIGDAVAMIDTKGHPDWSQKHVPVARNILAGCMAMSQRMDWTDRQKQAEKNSGDWYSWLFGSNAKTAEGPCQPTRSLVPHAVLWIMPYVEDADVKREIKAFFDELRNSVAFFEPVVVVTHLEACVHAQVRNARSCAVEFASDVGLHEHDSVFPLLAQRAAEGDHRDHGCGADVYLDPSVLYPVIRRLKHKAIKYLTLVGGAAFETV